MEVKNLTAKIHDSIIFENINLNLKNDELHILLGKNGSGKSTLAKILSGYNDFETTGEIIINNKILDKKIDVYARAGLFLLHQTPIEINGLALSYLIRAGLSIRSISIDPISLLNKLKSICHQYNFPEHILSRYVNYNLSGGEKRKSELLQMIIFNPSIVIADEIDSGVDIDSLNDIIKCINDVRKDKSFLIITHNIDFAKKLNPDFVHILNNKKLETFSSNVLDSIKDGFDGH